MSTLPSCPPPFTRDDETPAVVLRIADRAKVFALATMAIALVWPALGCPPTEPPACGAPACPDGTSLACLTMCEAVVPSGGECALDRCSTSPSGLCADGLTCLPNPFVAGVRVCIALPENGGVLGASCETGINFDPCSNDLWCNPTSCTGHTSTCALSGPVGSPCDSNFDKPVCDPCGPGGLCEGTGTSCSTGAPGKACHAPCATTADCPCDSNGTTSFTCADPYGQGMSCYECSGLQKACDSEHPCCDGSTCPGNCGTCCFASTQGCTSQAECCDGLVCSPFGTAGASPTCHACVALGAFCNSNLDCCDGACDTPSHTCREPQGGSCKGSADCANGTPCSCGVCSNLTPLGNLCAAGTTGTCLCSTSETGAGCTDNVCCVGKCATCETVNDCCKTPDGSIFQGCEGPSDGSSPIKRCCGEQYAPCETNDDCCSEHLCGSATKGAPLTCLPTPGQKFHNFCTTESGGCAATGRACTSATPCCLPSECTNGTCVVPASYEVVGYAYNFEGIPAVESTTTYVYQIPQGYPVAISAAEDAFVVTQTPDQLIAIPPGNVANAIVQVYPFVPHTIDAFPTNAADSTADLVVGANAQVAWLEQYNFTTNTDIRTNTVPVDGTVVALSPSPFFDMEDQDVAFAVGGTPSRLEYALLGNFPPTVPGNVDLTPYGSPVGVSTGSDNVWLLTNSQIASFGVVALGPLASAPLPVAGAPVAIAGGDVIGAIAADFVVAAFGPTSSSQAQIVAFHGGNVNDPAPISHTFAGNPVQMKVMATVDLEYAWVATTNPNQLLVFVVSTANSAPVGTVALPGAPIDLVVGVPHAVAPGGMVANVSGLVSVIVAR